MHFAWLEPNSIWDTRNRRFSSLRLSQSQARRCQVLPRVQAARSQAPAAGSAALPRFHHSDRGSHGETFPETAAEIAAEEAGGAAQPLPTDPPHPRIGPFDSRQR